MPGGWGILGGYGLSQRVKSGRIELIENYVHKLAKNSLEVDSSSNVTIIGKLLMSGSAAAIAIGTTPPTSATVGTGIWLDRTGMYGLASDVQQAIFDAATGKITAGAGAVSLASGGVAIVLAAAAADLRAYKFTDASGNVQSKLVAFDGGTNVVQLTADPISGKDSQVLIYSQGDSAKEGEVVIRALRKLDSTYSQITLTYDGTVNSMVCTSLTNTFDGGLNVGTATGAGIGDAAYSGDLQPYRNSTLYTAYAFVPLTTPLTSTAWDGDAYSTTAKTLIDLSAVFGVPAGVKAIMADVAVRDSGSSAANAALILSPTNTADIGMVSSCWGLPNDVWQHTCLTIPCDANGDVYYQAIATGAGTLDVAINIYGYWL